jgi:hypothetical protein
LRTYICSKECKSLSCPWWKRSNVIILPASGWLICKEMPPYLEFGDYLFLPDQVLSWLSLIEEKSLWSNPEQNFIIIFYSQINIWIVILDWTQSKDSVHYSSTAPPPPQTQDIQLLVGLPIGFV